jgi:glycosyltransferase involved in cell wall biosynthesis
MPKINLLVVPSDRTGVGKFRSVDPHIYLQNMYPDDFHVDIDYEPKLNDENFLKKYQIIHFHRTLGNYEVAPSLIEKINKMGIVTIIDLDDYWLPTREHPAHALVMETNLHQKIVNNTKAASYVTTTTSIYADEIKKINKNVFILPNAINPDESQFQAETEKSDILRFGWLGGSSHLHDINLLEGNFEKIAKYKDKFSVVLCGFDTRGTITEINPQTKEQKQRPIKPNETVWARYEEVFTNKYKLVSEKQKEFLLKFSNEEYVGEENPFYHRVWTQPVTSYAKNYRLFDVSLAPIKNHIFNRMKSQLKVIEAGFYKKALIASNVGPYTIDLKHSLESGNFVDGNALLVDENRNHGDWAKYMKKLIENPSWVEDLGERLYDTVKDTYHIKTVTKTRAELYKSLVK